MNVQTGDVISFRSQHDIPGDAPRYGIVATVAGDNHVNIIDIPEGNRWYASKRILPINISAYPFDMLNSDLLESAFGMKILNVLKRDEVDRLIKGAFRFIVASQKVNLVEPKKAVKKPNKEAHTKLTNFILDVIKGTKGKIFTVHFQKADCSMRTMNCRLGVSKYVKGTGKSHGDPKTITVFDLQANDYRSFNIDRVQWIKTGGKMYANPKFQMNW